MFAIKVLLVEDDQVIREFLAGALGRSGYEVFTASDGVEGLQQFHLRQPDLLITDLNMPRMNGYDLCHHVREISAVPTMFMTAAILDDSRIDLISVGVDAFLSKPFGSSKLLSVVDSLLSDANFFKPRATGHHRGSFERSGDELPTIIRTSAGYK